MRVRMFGSAMAAMVLLGIATGCAQAEAPGVATAGGAALASEATASAPASGDREDQMRAFAQCMRDHGVDVPDPQPGAGPGGGMALNLNPDDPTFRAAFEACRSKLPNNGEPPRLNAEQLEQYRQFAACMREHGVDVPDPNPDGTLALGPGRGPGRFDRNDPTFQAAITACRDKLTGVFVGRGQPGGAA
jgi:hypothetical protein